MATFIRQAVGNGTSSPLSVTITAAANQHYLTVCVMSRSSNPSNRTVSSISCTNTTFALITGASGSTGRFGCEIWLGKVSGGVSGTSVSITMSGTVSDICANVAEWSDVLVAATVGGSFDSTTGNSGTATNNSPSVSTGISPQSSDLLIACVGYASATAPTQDGSSFTFRALTFTSNSTNGIGLQADYNPQNFNIGIVSEGWTLASSVAWIGVIAGVLSSYMLDKWFVESECPIFDRKAVVAY